MTLGSIAAMLIAGVGVGLLSNILGLGGGVIMVPAFLAFVPGIDTHTAVGTSLVIVFVVVFYNALRMIPPMEQKPWALAAQLVVGSIAGGAFSAWGTSFLPERALLSIFVLLLGVLAVRTFLLNDSQASNAPVRKRPGRAVGIGMLSGLVGGATGTGGGIVLVPMLLITRMSTNETVVGLSNLVMAAIAAAGSMAHLRATPVYAAPWTVGHVYLPLVPLILAGALTVAPFARRIGIQLSPRRRQLLLGTMLTIIVIQLALRIVRP